MSAIDLMQEAQKDYKIFGWYQVTYTLSMLVVSQWAFDKELGSLSGIEDIKRIFMLGYNLILMPLNAGFAIWHLFQLFIPNSFGGLGLMWALFNVMGIWGLNFLGAFWDDIVLTYLGSF